VELDVLRALRAARRRFFSAYAPPLRHTGIDLLPILSRKMGFERGVVVEGNVSGPSGPAKGI
jgi:hypothetical protein